MSVPSSSDQPASVPSGGGARGKAAKAVAAVVAIAALAFGAASITHKSTTSAASASGVPGAPGGRFGGPGMGTQVTGTTLAKLESVVTAKYPGTIEHAFELPNGSYEVHVIRATGSEVHVLVSKAFRITGTETGGPGGPPNGAMPGGTPPTGTAPNGTAPGATSSSS